MIRSMHTVAGASRFTHLTGPSDRSTEWDEFMLRAKGGHVLQSIGWAAYRRKLGWRSYLLSWSPEGSIRAGCIVLHRRVARLPLGGLLYVPRGPVMDYESSDAPCILSEILDTLKQLARRRVAVVRISPDVGPEATWVEAALREKEFDRAKQPIQHTVTMRLNLMQPLDEIVARMERGRRYWVRRIEADRSNWSFSSDNAPDALRVFYRMYHETLLRSGESPKTSNEMLLMHQTLAPVSSSFVFIVKFRNRPVAGAVVVATGKRLWYLYGGSAKGDDAESGAGVSLHWEIIKWAKERGYVEYDLQGVPDQAAPGDPLYGVYLFKRGWGGRLVNLVGEYDYSPYPLLKTLLHQKVSRTHSS